MSCNNAAKPGVEIEKAFPFSKADKIEIISYPMRYMWDTIGKGDMTPVIDKKLAVTASGIKDRIVANEKVKQRLFNLFFTKYQGNCEMAMCFEPRHCILFYKDSDIIAYIEVCLACGTRNYSDGFTLEEICHGRTGELRRIFEEAGIKYFGDGEEY